MGNFSSKELQDLVEFLEPPTQHLCEISTPVYKSAATNSDPPSPTVGISQTPIEINKAVLSPMMPRHLKSDSTVILKNETEMAIPSHLITNDPRSPSLGITRTPIQVVCTSCEAECTAKSLMLIADPRSPNIHLCRTPIQVNRLPAEDKVSSTFQASTGLETNLDAVQNIARNTATNVTEKSRIQERLNQARENEHDSKWSGEKWPFYFDKENETALKRKLFDTPDSSPVQASGCKMRTPLGSMSNFQPSPSQFLRVKQSLKLEQELEPQPRTTPRKKGLSRRQQLVTWDRDATFIM